MFLSVYLLSTLTIVISDRDLIFDMLTSLLKLFLLTPKPMTLDVIFILKIVFF